jgi:hypothetical protein
LKDSPEVRHKSNCYYGLGLLAIEIDHTIHRIVNVVYKNCPATREEIKAGTADVEKWQEFIQKLISALEG